MATYCPDFVLWMATTRSPTGIRLKRAAGEGRRGGRETACLLRSQPGRPGEGWLVAAPWGQLSWGQRCREGASARQGPLALGRWQCQHCLLDWPTGSEQLDEKGAGGTPGCAAPGEGRERASLGSTHGLGERRGRGFRRPPSFLLQGLSLCQKMQVAALFPREASHKRG